MIVSVDLACAVFRKVELIREEYHAKVLNGDQAMLSIESLRWVLESMYQRRILTSLVPFEGEFIRGMVERWKDRLQIYVRANQPRDWLRFTAVKEMCHAFIDEPADWSTEGVKTLDGVLVEYRLTEGAVAPRTAQSEIFAELAAIELLYPYDDRVRDLAKLAAPNADLSITKIANYYGIPTAMVSRALASGHHTFSTRIWNELGRANALEWPVEPVE